MTETKRSPQARIKCACPAWSTARSCIHLRYAPGDDEPYEECECPCHEEEDDDDFSDYYRDDD